jgi:hypothetical protein
VGFTTSFYLLYVSFKWLVLWVFELRWFLSAKWPLWLKFLDTVGLLHFGVKPSKQFSKPGYISGCYRGKWPQLLIHLHPPNAFCIYGIPCMGSLTSYSVQFIINFLREHRHNLQQGLLEKWKLAQHACEEGHRIEWDDARILEIESNSRYRKYKESVHMACLTTHREDMYDGTDSSLDFIRLWSRVFRFYSIDGASSRYYIA